MFNLVEHMLHARVDLDDKYVRDIVLAAFERRSDAWTIDHASSVLYHWGEYERVDWDAVYAGEVKPTAPH